MFLRQVLEADGSCQKAVNGWAAQRAADGLSLCSVRTGGYCRARQRLPLEVVSTLTRETGRLLSQKALAPWLRRGRSVKLVDGTGISMPDTPENQERYPQPSTQAPGVGFPLARLVMVICLATGAALDMAVGPHSGKGTGELGLVRGLLQCFSPGDVMLADALYCNYFLIATLMAAGVGVLFEQNGSRITDFRRWLSLGTRDHVVHWPKHATRPEWMTPEQYTGFPDELRVREVKVAHQVLVTTLLNPSQCQQGRSLGAVRASLERRARPAQSQNHHGHGRAELPDAADERETIVGSSTGLQRDPTTHGAGRLQCRYRPARPELQTHRTTVDGVGRTRSVGYEGLRAAVHLDRPVQGGQPARTHRADNAKATTQTLPVVKGPACPCPPKNQDTWSRLGAKVSAIRPRPP